MFLAKVIRVLLLGLCCGAALYLRTTASEVPLRVDKILENPESLRHHVMVVQGHLVWDGGFAGLSAARFGQSGDDKCLNVRFRDARLADQFPYPKNHQDAVIRGKLEEYDCRGANNFNYKQCMLRCSDWTLDQAEFVDR